MKKRIVAFLLAMCLLGSLLPQAIAPARAFGEYEETAVPYAVEGGNIYFKRGTGTVFSCDDTVTRADIPAEIEGVAVKFIGENAFAFCEKLTDVSIPDGVIAIGEDAFEMCTSLVNVNIPDTVTSIGRCAFLYCSSITSVTVPAGAVTIGEFAFQGCDRLTAITVDEKNPNYCSDAHGVLFNKAKTTLIQAPGAIAGAYVIPASVTTLGNRAFSFSAALTSVTIPNGVTVIPEQTFRQCTSLTSVTNSNRITSIGEQAFYGCSSLSSITIPATTTTIAEDAFQGCSSMTAITVDKQNPIYSSDERGVLFDKEKTTILRAPGGIGPDYTIPSGVASIANDAFNGCARLTHVVVPASIVSIGSFAFYECRSLISVRFLGNQPQLGDNAFTIYTPEDLWNGENHSLTLYCPDEYSPFSGYQWNLYRVAPWKTFADVKPSAWYYDAVVFTASLGVFNGNPDGTFQPGQPMTRAMLVTTLYRMVGEPSVDFVDRFTDVKSGRYYSLPVEWAAANGIVKGMGNNEFQPNTNVTREQAATFLYRLAEYDFCEPTARADLQKFPDADKVSDFARESLSWANAEGLINGKKNTQTGVVTLDPKGNATRAELATVLTNYKHKVSYYY